MAGASVVRPTRTMTGERRWKKTKVTIRPSEPGDNSRAEKEKKKKKFKCKSQKKIHNYACR